MKKTAEQLPDEDGCAAGFVKHTVEILLARQTARVLGKPDGAECVTVSRAPMRQWTSIGIWDHDHFQLFDIAAAGIQMAPTFIDLDAWPVLEQLSRRTGDARYARMVTDMARAFGRHGFDPVSGLPYHGQMACFDVARAGGAGMGVTSPDPYFKPLHGLPWERLWAAAPQQMARFCKASYFALVTRPQTMDFTRFVPYGIDDRARNPMQAFNPMGRGFVYTAAMLIQYWIMNFLHTGDRESLAWAQAMTGKWIRLQHPETGLLPHFIGALDPDDPEQSPSPYANCGDALVAIMFLEAAQMLAGMAEHRDLAARLAGLGARSLRGMARHACDPARRIFVDWIKLDGGEYTNEPQYAFRSQAEKDAALKRDPNVARVSVFAGESFYLGPAFYSLVVQGLLPQAVMKGAAITRDPELIERAHDFAAQIMPAARARKGPRNSDGQWCFPATGGYVQGLLALREATEKQQYLDWARELAGQEIGFLSREPAGDMGAQQAVDWWRLPERSQFLEALLQLDAAG